MINPTSWGDISRCGCNACQGMWQIRSRCLSLRGSLAVWDCRMFGKGFRVADTDQLFRRPATLPTEYESVEAAADYVLSVQKHCDAFVSSWPMKPTGEQDFAWAVQTVK